MINEYYGINRPISLNDEKLILKELTKVLEIIKINKPKRLVKNINRNAQ